MDHAFLLVPAQQYVGKFLATFKEFPPSQKVGSFSLDQVMDLLISGGGDWGAFGAGVLKGWGRVKGELARPQFDVVTGVSTGALIAPFAFLGDDESIERIVQLYRNPQTDCAVRAGLLFFLPSNPSFYVLPGLERELRSALDRPMLERIAAEDASGRALLVNTTNVDFGDMHAWDIVAESARRRSPATTRSACTGSCSASAGIPAIFPAREIGEYLYVDGAITGNILYGGRDARGREPARAVAGEASRRADAARALLGDLQQPVPLPAAGDAGALARHHGPRHDHGDADLDGECHAPPLREGGDRASSTTRTWRCASSPCPTTGCRPSRARSRRK